MEKPWEYHGEWSAAGGPSAKNPWGLRHLGFWPWDLSRHSIHHDTLSAFPNNVPVCHLQTGRARPGYRETSPGLPGSSRATWMVSSCGRFLHDRWQCREFFKRAHFKKKTGQKWTLFQQKADKKRAKFKFFKIKRGAFKLFFSLFP